jgi:hypothetical protein
VLGGTAETTYRVNNAVTWRELDGEIVVLDSRKSVYFSIGGVGGILWHRLVTGASLGDLIEEITSTYSEMSPDHAAADIEEFITSCLDDGLIEATTP